MLVALCWVVVSCLGLAAILRILDWDGVWWPFVLIDAATIVVYLPAWLVALVGLALRRRALAALALALVVCQVVFLLPEWRASVPPPAWVAHAAVIRLFDANVRAGNLETASYAAPIRRARPDLVTLEEATPLQAQALEATGALAGLRHRYEVNWDNPFAFLVASRYRLSNTRTVFGNGEPLAVVTTVHLPVGPITLLVVHTVSPVPVSWHQWASDLKIIRTLVRRLGTRRLLVAGDFNATWGNRGFVGVVDTGLTDAAAGLGHVFQMTWPQGMGVPPFVRIDHVLTGTGLAVTHLRTTDGPGSDHRALVATLAVRRAPRT